MILSNLRDRHPEMFGPRTRHQMREYVAVWKAKVRRRTTEGPLATGTGKRRIAQERLARYMKGLLLLMLNPKIQRELAELRDREMQLAQTGGVEAPAHGD